MISEEIIKKFVQRREEYLHMAAYSNKKEWASFLRGKASAMDDIIYELRRCKANESCKPV